MSERHWTDAHITTDPKTGRFLAWDETGADTVGSYKHRHQAVLALLRYSDFLEKQRKEQGQPND